jgi:hypothetical protein
VFGQRKDEGIVASFDSRVQRFCALSGAASMIIGLGGQVAVLPWGQQGWVYHQPSFGASAQTWAAFYGDNRIGIMVGTAGFEIAWVLLLFFSVQFALMTWRLDSGGDVKQRAKTGDYGPTEPGVFQIERLHQLIRDLPKPVIAAVNGHAFNADSEAQAGISKLGMASLDMFGQSDEAVEGARAFAEKRTPEFSKFG